MFSTYWMSRPVAAFPGVLVFLLTRRIPVEEAALSSGLGAAYLSYMRRTKRLVPWIY